MNDRKWFIALCWFLGMVFFAEILLLDSVRQKQGVRLEALEAQVGSLTTRYVSILEEEEMSVKKGSKHHKVYKRWGKPGRNTKLINKQLKGLSK